MTRTQQIAEMEKKIAELKSAEKEYKEKVKSGEPDVVINKLTLRMEIRSNQYVIRNWKATMNTLGQI
ncbi:MAG: hypothetical protein LUE27_06910 [Clostridia bacterium]|nr:hypothetical protein [Clostridia bacterium]